MAGILIWWSLLKNPEAPKMKNIIRGTIRGTFNREEEKEKKKEKGE